MRVATWNVNSIRTRAARVVDWLGREDVDVLAMQEIKCTEAQFPFERFEEAGYEVLLHGLNQWNGVAFASRVPMEDVERGFPSAPGFGKPDDQGALPLEARAMGVTVNGVRLWSLYVPNGRDLDHDHYAYKLDWLAKLAHDTRAWLATNPEQPLALMGDWNIAPLDTDVWPTWPFGSTTHTSAPERAAFAEFEALGLTDVVRERVPEGFTFWDYQQLRFPRNEGMRIDFILGSRPFADLVTAAGIHREERKGDGPSDHVPVVVDLDLDTGDDDRPMIPARARVASQFGRPAVRVEW
jgi:exodeoxyribonuclease-3